MKKEILEKYENRFIVIGVPHTYRDNALFYYTGILTNLGDETITIERENDELTLEYGLIKSVKASGSGAYEGN